jgi:hypothetical protein
MSSEMLSSEEEIQKAADAEAAETKVGVDLPGKALPTLEEKDEGEKKSGVGDSLSKFASSVGNALTGVAEFLPNKIEEISSDPKKRKNFLRGLNIIAESSGYDSKIRSPFGKVAGGLLKAEESFIAEDLAKLKAMKKDAPRIRDIKEEGILKMWTDYDKRYTEKEKAYKSTDVRTSELMKLAERGIDSPTGLIENLLTPLQKVASELGLGEKYEDLSKSIQGKKTVNELTNEEKVVFKDIFGAATKAGIVSQVKDLYPASDKDIQVLLQTMGDVSTNPKALAALVAAEKSAKEIETLGRERAGNIAFEEKDIEFEKKGKDQAAKILANKYKDQVKPETFKLMYGDDSESMNNPFRIINAYYYQQLSPKYEKDLGSFDTYLKTKASKIDSTKNLIIEKQKELLTK